jgi:Uma2 family endonuclease
MATILRLGPCDHGRPLTYEEFTSGDFARGYRYELIEGKLEVTPAPDLPGGRVEGWLLFKLQLYVAAHPELINYVYNKTRVFVPGQPELTTPEPDIAAYRDFPLERPFDEVDWRDVSPVLVVEVLSNDPDKDLVRNADLYFQVPSIREYWVLDPRGNAEQPTMRVHRRHGKRWVVRDLAYGDTYTTRLLPGFELTIDPRT